MKLTIGTVLYRYRYLAPGVRNSIPKSATRSYGALRGRHCTEQPNYDHAAHVCDSLGLPLGRMARHPG